MDDDCRGFGPYKVKLTISRKGDKAYFDHTGTDPQSEGPINYYLNEHLLKMFIGVYLIMTHDPQILFNDGFYPLRIEAYTSVIDSGGAGYHRGGNGLLKVYHFLAEGEISIHDDRWLTYQWGVNGGRPAARGKKWLKRADGTIEYIPSKCDHVKVVPGDELFYQTWGAGGYGDPLTREPERVQKDVRFRLVSVEKARNEYGVVIDPQSFKIDKAATEALRAELAAKRGAPKPFDFGPPMEEILRNCKAETGLEPPKPPVFKKHVARMPIFKPKPSHARLVPKDVYDKAFGKKAKRRTA